jgi:hypothetical protein
MWLNNRNVTQLNILQEWGSTKALFKNVTQQKHSSGTLLSKNTLQECDSMTLHECYSTKTLFRNVTKTLFRNSTQQKHSSGM